MRKPAPTPRELEASCLTPREEQLLRAYGRTKSYARAARSLDLAESTYRNALSAVYRKLDVDCALAAFEKVGIFDPEGTVHSSG
jgi:DNA-binding NarL/FixJ family response regulator